MRKAILAAALSLTLAQPVSAQVQDEDRPGIAQSDANALREIEALTATFGDIFASEPLTPEQEARLPLAEAVVARIFPPGTYARMMDEMMAPMTDSILGSMAQLPLARIAAIAGLEQSQIAAMDEAKQGEVMAIVDPVHERRSAIASEVMLEMMGEMAERVEPAYRKGLTRAYAVRFEPADLAEIDRFFRTPIGSRYAAESMLIYADPQVMSAMNEIMPAVIEMLPTTMERMQQRMADLPEPREISDLNDDELQKLADLLGIPAEDLRAGATETDESTPVVVEAS